METLKILFSEFWTPFLGAGVCVSVVWFLRRSAVDGRLPFLSPKAFAELAGQSTEEQKRLLHRASTEAFRHWRSFLPAVVLAFFFGAGASVAHTLPKVTTIPDSWWVTLPIMMGFAGIGGWLALTLTAHYVRPFLQTFIERSHNSA